MICPFCGHENIDGVDTCDHCTHDLTVFDEPEGRTQIEAAIMTEALAALKPKPPAIVPPETTVAHAVTALCENNIGCLLIGTSAALKGVFSERDILLKVAHQYQHAESHPVSRYMTPDPETLEVDVPIAFALNRMSIGDYRHIPVTQHGRLIGIVSVRDVLALLGEWYPDLFAAAPPK